MFVLHLPKVLPNLCTFFTLFPYYHPLGNSSSLCVTMWYVSNLSLVWTELVAVHVKQSYHWKGSHLRRIHGLLNSFVDHNHHSKHSKAYSSITAYALLIAVRNYLQSSSKKSDSNQHHPPTKINNRWWWWWWCPIDILIKPGNTIPPPSRSRTSPITIQFQYRTFQPSILFLPTFLRTVFLHACIIRFAERFLPINRKSIGCIVTSSDDV